MHPYHQQWKEANVQEWKRADLVLEAPEMRQVGQRCAVTANGTEIGRSHINKPKASPAGESKRPAGGATMKKLLEILGSMTALFVAVAFFAALLLLLSGCSGPTEAQAEIDGAAWLIEAGIDDEVQRRLAIALAKGERL